MARRWLRVWGFAWVVAATTALVSSRSDAISLDDRDEIKVGVRSYVNARIGTQNTENSFKFGSFNARESGITEKSKTFPYSPAGHLRQNRFFIEVEWKHDIDRLREEGFGPLALLNHLPFRVRNLQYGLTYRGEGDGLYDWGPSEFRTAEQWNDGQENLCPDNDVRGCLSRNPATGAVPNTPQLRKDLRHRSVHRSRLFQAYIEADIGSRIWFRFGRQILSWGETDAFRLIDNINPIDSSFGGFLVSLDERRMPLDMLRTVYRIGDIGPLYDTFIEAYAAIDNSVGFDPGTPAGSPWGLPNTGVPGANTLSKRVAPTRSFSDTRGGARFVFNWGDGTFSLAHYYTYLDIPSIETSVLPNFPNKRGVVDEYTAYPGGFSVKAVQKPELTQITGGTATFALPDLYSIVRGEFAFFHNEARFKQSQLDPFIYHYYGRVRNLGTPNEDGLRFVYDESAPLTLLNPGVLTRACAKKVPNADGSTVVNDTDERLCNLSGGRRTGDSLKMVLGWDTNQFIRFLNPHQSFFITTQFFYQHLLDYQDRSLYQRTLDDGRVITERLVQEGEVLPVTEFDTYVPQAGVDTFGAVEPNLISQPQNTFLNTLLITTNYMSGMVTPSFVFFYDWGGATVFVPGITFAQDPWRFSIDYSMLSASRLKGGSGVSLVRDRDTVQFRFEYVI